MIRSGDTYGIDLLISDELPVISVGLAILALIALVDLVLRVVQVVIVDIANGGDLNILITHEGSHVAAAHAANTDNPHDDPFTGRDRTTEAQGASGYEIRNG